MPTEAIKNRSPEIQAARNQLRRKGWSHETAASQLGVTRVHLTLVLNGRRESRRILKGIQELTENPKPA